MNAATSRTAPLSHSSLLSLSHHPSPVVLFVRVELVGKSSAPDALPALARAEGISTLNHEALDISVKFCPIVVPTMSQVERIPRGSGGIGIGVGVRGRLRAPAKRIALCTYLDMEVKVRNAYDTSVMTALFQMLLAIAAACEGSLLCPRYHHGRLQ